MVTSSQPATLKKNCEKAEDQLAEKHIAHFKNQSFKTASLGTFNTKNYYYYHYYLLQTSFIKIFNTSVL